MKVTTVTVEVKETRNHPTAYGNRGARVAYTVELEEGDTPDAATVQLRQQARVQVDGELDQWISEIELENKRYSARSTLNHEIYNVREGYFSDDQKAEFEDNLQILPPDEQEKYRQALAKAQETFLENTRRRLDDLIGRIETSGDLTSRRKELFENALAHLPEAERKSYQDRMDVAIAPKPEAVPTTEPIAQVADMAPDEWEEEPTVEDDDEEEMPF